MPFFCHVFLCKTVYLGYELVKVFKVLVHRGKADVCHLVRVVKPFQNQFPQL